MGQFSLTFGSGLLPASKQMDLASVPNRSIAGTQVLSPSIGTSNSTAASCDIMSNGGFDAVIGNPPYILDKTLWAA